MEQDEIISIAQLAGMCNSHMKHIQNDLTSESKNIPIRYITPKDVLGQYQVTSNVSNLIQPKPANVEAVISDTPDPLVLIDIPDNLKKYVSESPNVQQQVPPVVNDTGEKQLEFAFTDKKEKQESPFDYIKREFFTIKEMIKIMQLKINEMIYMRNNKKNVKHKQDPIKFVE